MPVIVERPDDTNVSFLKKVLIYLKHRYRCWRSGCAIGWQQEGSIIYVDYQRLGLFKLKKGKPFRYVVDIDKSQLTAEGDDV